MAQPQRRKVDQSLQYRWGFVGAILAIAGFTLAPYAQRLHPAFDLAGQFLLQVCAATVLGLAFFALRRRPVAVDGIVLEHHQRVE